MLCYMTRNTYQLIAEFTDDMLFNVTTSSLMGGFIYLFCDK